jgi:nucleoside-diphosphate-sugar epimerase/uncharacterized membrane protein
LKEPRQTALPGADPSKEDRLKSSARQVRGGSSSADTIVITGSSGFLGRSIAEKLGKRFGIVGLDVIEPKKPVSGVATVRVDVTSNESVRRAVDEIDQLSGGRVASVVHLAGYYDLSGDPSPKYEAVTVRGTERLLRELRRIVVEQFVFASTMLVHAPSVSGRLIDEDSRLEAKTPYPQSKLDSERLLHEKRGDIPLVVLRLAGVYDELCRAAFLAQQIANINERQFVSYLYPGDPGSGQPYLHVEDLVDAIERVVDRRKELPRDTTLLLGEPETLSYDEVQKITGWLLHGEEWETRQIPKALAKVGQWAQEDVLDLDPFIQPWMIDQASDDYRLDISRARQVLGWQPRHSLRETLPKMIAALKADPPGWYEANKLNAAKVAADDAVLAKARLGGGPSEQARRAVSDTLAAEQSGTLWAHLLNAALGAWLITGPFVYGLFETAPDAPAPPAAGHALPSPAARDFQLATSEIVSGVLVIVFSALAMSRRGWAQWAAAAVGLWVLFAPLVFWTTSAAAYSADTLIGALVIVFAVMVPPQPGISREALADASDLPLGWTYSPSSHVQRVPILALAFVGLLVSRYLTAYQLGHIDSVWDPFFEGTPGTANGTEAVITSSVSKAFPIADAGFGAIAYVLDILTGAIGDRRRWRTMPWLVLIFGLLIVPLGFVSVGFIIIQPTLIGALCFLCLVQAAITVLMIPYSVDEVLASVQFLWRRHRAGLSFWRSLFAGGRGFGEGRDPAPNLDRSFANVMQRFLSGGVSYPWTLIASAAFGVWLISTPLTIGTEAPLAFSDHIAGCLVFTVAITAMGEVTRPLRFFNVLLGLWVAASPFVLGGGGIAVAANLAVGLAIAGLSLSRGKMGDEHYGGWDRFMI